MRIDELKIGTEVKFTILDNYKDNRGSGKVSQNLDGGDSIRGVCYVELKGDLGLAYNTLVVDSLIAEFGQMIFIWTGVDACIISKNDKYYLMLVSNKYGLLYNRRNAQRFKIETLCTVIFEDNSSCSAVVKDISASGIGLKEFSHEVTKGDTIYVIFNDVSEFVKTPSINFEEHQLYKASVVRTECTADGLEVGCQFCNNYKTPIFTIT